MIIRTFIYEEDNFSGNAEGISKIYHEVFLILKFLKTKQQAKKMSFN